MMETEFCCDFCERPVAEPKRQGWTYPCDDFSFALGSDDRGTKGPIQRMIGGWLACESCSAVAESGSPRLLAQHVAGGKAAIRASRRKREAVEIGLTAMYTGFFAARTGARRRPSFSDEFTARFDRSAAPGSCHLGTLAQACSAKAGVEVRTDDELSVKLGIEWFPACFACARIHLKVVTDAPVVPDGIKVRALSGVAPELPR